jgi:hypothetical protein
VPPSIAVSMIRCWKVRSWYPQRTGRHQQGARCGG